MAGVAELNFQSANGKWESDVFQFDEDAALEINFETVPEYRGVDIYILQSLNGDNWQLCYNYTLRNGRTFCKTVVGYSRVASYKIVCSQEPESAYYVQ